MTPAEAADGDETGQAPSPRRRRKRGPEAETASGDEPTVFESLLNAFRAPDIRRRILFVLGILIVFRLLRRCRCRASTARQLPSSSRATPLFGILDLFAGGGLSKLSIVGAGVNPYINASIIMQLMTGVIPSLQALSREGEYGRNRLNQYTRYLTVPMALLQAFGILRRCSARRTS